MMSVQIDHSGRASICRGCWDQMHMPIPIRGPLAIPFRVFGITRSKMNPNICTICERSFRYVKKQQHISTTATILFADIRGYTNLSERMDPIAMSEIVSVFQDQCARAIWARDGIVNKQMGDGLMAIFNFPINLKCILKNFGIGSIVTLRLHSKRKWATEPLLPVRTSAGLFLTGVGTVVSRSPLNT